MRIQKILFFVSMCALTIPMHMRAQSVSTSDISVTIGDDGFIISGSFEASNLNPEGQIVENDNVEVIAEIPIEDEYEYPVLWDGMTIRKPDDAETFYVKGDEYLTKEQMSGVGITTVALMNSAPIREPSVWSAYGGLGTWRDNAPESVEVEFSGTIPFEYDGKTIRIRTTLNHVYGGPNAPWSAYTFHHDTTEITLDRSVFEEDNTSDNMSDNDNKKSSNTSNANTSSSDKKKDQQVSDKVKDIFNASISIFKKQKSNEEKRTDIGMTTFKEPEKNPYADDPELKEKIEQTLNAIANNKSFGASADISDYIKNTETSGGIHVVGNLDGSTAPDDTFQKKYWLNKYILDPFIDKIADYIPVGKYYKDYAKAEKDNALFTTPDEKADKTALDYNVDKLSAKQFEKYNKIIDQEKKMSPMKNIVPDTPATKPISWTLDLLGWGAKKQYATELGKEYKYIRKEIQWYMKSGRLTQQQAIDRVKKDYVGFQGDIGNGAMEKMDTGIKWWGSKKEYDTSTRFDDMVDDMIKNDEFK
jgi:hypothetical protein